MSESNNLAKNTLIFGVSGTITKLIQFALLSLYTSVLSKEQFGFVELLNSTTELLVPILTLSISESALRYALDKNSSKSAILSNGLAIVIIGVLFVFFLYPFFVSSFSNNIALCFCFLYATSATRQLLGMFARGINEIRLFFFSSVLNAFALLIFSYFLLIYNKSGITGYLLAIIFSNLLSIIVLFFFGKMYSMIRYTAIDRMLMKQMCAFSLPLVPGLISWWLINVSGRFFVLEYRDVAAAGLFTAASKLPASVNLLTTMFQQSWQISASATYDENGRDQFYSEVFKSVSALILIFGSLMIALAPYLSKLLLIGEFYSAWIYSPFLILAAVASCYSAFIGTIFFAAKRNAITMRTTIAGAMVNVVLCILLIKPFGILGASVAGFASYTFIVGYRFLELNKFVSIQVDLPKLLFSALLLLVQATVASFGEPRFFWVSFLMFFLTLLIHHQSLKGLLKQLSAKIMNHLKHAAG
ncbi:MAG TPA: hypothetical protein DCS07_11400 [Bdellovibrionales bacterium]|nr:MAG: hypothetical protein A2Z97_12870 [Bdellovibrionales bacterium GWB1_52_6]OFZ02825.1 MAG: hypothetical protein A2X97_04430 [Bdellovibrionales bacterium GWA1_52_35]OFZ33501.1 MAG: hypothetical protein A2070_14835 [Bdellovibrionales bacterium GWC1_52_8]HAR43214.1 hypothetical protein [Bdellovibrionales bacterium]HCM38407.1 hypothetical protein [Bdellovibrionales bacterium]